MSDFKETCIWMSYRYAIGRKAIASVMHAEDIAKHMGWVPMDRWAFTGMDILREVNDRIGWYKNIHIESYGDPTIDIFSVIFQFILARILSTDEFGNLAVLIVLYLRSLQALPLQGSSL